jgi:UDP-N-acetylmuramoyl-L-alanyl-D-glutamate--2,6-diaminopimelate ligase
MRLETLIRDLSPVQVEGHLDREVRALAYHSAHVSEDSLFAALRGTRSDGHDFIRQALDRGARTVVVERPQPPLAEATVIEVPNTRSALALLANRFYGFPSRTLTLIGITGTNGKTTTAYLLESILAACGYSVGVIGTINVRYPGHVQSAPVTTPESLDLQRILAGMLAAGVTHVVMEISSHGLHMHRVDGTRFAVGLFTNLSRDHLDYHGSMDDYFAAKSRLFSQILHQDGPPPALAVINADDDWGQRLCSLAAGPLLRYGFTPDAEVRVQTADCRPSGIRAVLQTPAGELEIHSSLLGRLNVHNLLAATAAAVGLGLPREAVLAGLESLVRVPGRLESVPNELGITVLVDYAHTPDALEQSLHSLSELRFPRIICVFGCGGDRDRGKRPLMGAAAARGADLLFITSDNPRNENPEAIIAEIETGVRRLGLTRLSSPADCEGDCGRAYLLVPDRGEAIRSAVECAAAGEAVYIGGKGHETYQIVGSERIAFDDRLVAAAALAARKQRENGQAQQQGSPPGEGKEAGA